jgi:hypothetical protein
MPRNTFRSGESSRVTPPKRSFKIIDPLFNWVNEKLEIDEKISFRTFKKVLWLMFLVVFYIFFQHNFDGLIRKLNKTEKELNETRAKYISTKSKYLYASKHSEIEEKLIDRGFESNPNPPIKIAVKTN